MKKVTGIIFAGGYGKRLLPLTESIPKPLLELQDGYTILDKQILDFKYAGISEVYLLIGHLADKIKERYNDSYKGVKVKYLVEDKPMGTLYALSNALKRIKSDIVVRNGDVVSDVNLMELVKRAQAGDDLVTIVVTRMQSPFGIVESTDRKVISFKEKPFLDIFINAGAYYIKKEAFPYFHEEYDRSEIEFTVFPKLVEDRMVAPYHEDSVFWRSVDGLKDLEAVRGEYENREDKPWGYERIIVNNPKYLVKELYIKKDFMTSVHYHPRKDESMHVLSGEGYIDFSKEKKRETMRAGSVLQVVPNRTHSIVAKENLRIYEYSTPHPDDSVRIKDFYER